MSSIAEDIAVLKTAIAKFEGLLDAATTPEERRDLLQVITATRTQQTELIRLSGNVTDCDFNNPAVFYFLN